MLEALGGFLGELLETTPPSLDGPAARGAVGAAEDRPALPRARPHRSLPAPALGADGGGGSRRRVVRDRPAAGRRRGARHLRRGAGPVVGRHGRVAAPERGGRSGAGRQQRDRQGRTGRADARDGRRGARGGRRDPHRRGGRPGPRARRPRRRRRARRRQRDQRARGRLERRSEAHLPRPRRSGRARSQLPRADPQLPLPGNRRRR